MARPGAAPALAQATIAPKPSRPGDAGHVEQQGQAVGGVGAQVDVGRQREQHAALAVGHREAAVRAHVEAGVFQRADQGRHRPRRALRGQVHAQLGVVAGDEAVQVLRFAHHFDHVRHFRLGADFVGHRAQARDHFRVFEFVQGRGAGGQLHAGLQLGVHAAVHDRLPVAVHGQADEVHRLVADAAQLQQRGQDLVAARGAFQRQRDQAVDQRVDQVLGQFGRRRVRRHARQGERVGAPAARRGHRVRRLRPTARRPPAPLRTGARPKVGSMLVRGRAVAPTSSTGSLRSAGVRVGRGASARRHGRTRRRARRSCGPCTPATCCN
jgi:hypothetical protein